MKTPNITPDQIRTHKNKAEPLVCLTAYTTPMAKILDAHCDIMLVGDSVGTVLYGMDNTLSVSLEMMVNHGKAVMRANPKSCVIVDMPYGTYEASPEEAYDNAARIIAQTGCAGIKLEGGVIMLETIRHLVDKGIPVMGHIGLQPQSVIKDGGYKIKGRTNEEISDLLEDAISVEKAGAFAVVIEGTIESVARNITESINIPTIGIGASKACDGQILVTHDMLGLITDHVPKFVKQYADLTGEIERAVRDYAHDVKAGNFPDKNHIYKGKA